MESGKPAPTLRLAAVMISIILAWLTYAYVEKPIRFGRMREGRALLLLLAMVVVGSAGFEVYRYNGVPARLPELVQQLASYHYDPIVGWGPCSLHPKQQAKDFELCRESLVKTKKTLVLWGDSHAAHLYPGYKLHFEGEFNIVERTASQCPPILGLDKYGRPFCKGINDSVIDYIERTKPHKVVLSGLWVRNDWKRIELTITRLKSAGIHDIDLVGPAPFWNGTLAKQLYLYFEKDSLHRIPSRMKFGLNQNFLKLDPLMAESAKEWGVNYVSLASIFCNAEGCITKLGDTGSALVSFDYGHLTDIGSQFAVSRFPGADGGTPRNR